MRTTTRRLASAIGLIAAGKTLELITAFDLPRLADGRLVGEKGTAVGH